MTYREGMADSTDAPADPGRDVADRRGAIADAAIAIIAGEGLRALTHRAVDRRLRLPDGSTSYYARTRADLIELVVRRLAARTSTDVSANSAAAETVMTVGAAADRVAVLIDTIAARSEDQLARFALAVDLRGDPDLHAFITSGSPIREQLLARARALAVAIDARDVEQAALGLLAVVDGLLFDRLAGSGVDAGVRPDAAAVVAAYLSGLRTNAP